MRSFVQKLSQPSWELVNLQPGDWDRVSLLLETYQDAHLDFVDATIVAIAERLEIDVVLTLDRRGFQMIRPLHAEYFTILP